MERADSLPQPEIEVDKVNGSIRLIQKVEERRGAWKKSEPALEMI